MLNKEFLQQMKKDLISQKEQLLIKANVLPDIDSDGDETDEVQANLLIEIDNQLSGRNIDKINKIDEALYRIKNDVYGICDDCENLISEKRLHLNPYFLTCVLCAELREAEEKQRKRY